MLGISRERAPRISGNVLGTAEKRTVMLRHMVLTHLIESSYGRTKNHRRAKGTERHERVEKKLHKKDS